jgi:2-oxoglutarate/2-oxoacid ferredoxin oxidoreductase subunit alpha
VNETAGRGAETRRELIKGNEAIAMGALDAGLKFYFGYPITPQNDIPEYLSFHLPKAGGAFIQAESEIASINMVLGAAATGKRSMTSSSSPGISLMQEGISYMAGSEIPGVIVNISRSGPGLGGISPSQGDYFQATRGGGHGDYRTMVLAPNSVQELYDLTIAAFDLADTYRNPVVILGDSILGQIKEPMVRHRTIPPTPAKPWALTGAQDRAPQLLKSLYLAEGELTVHNWKLKEKYDSMANDARYDTYLVDDAQLIVSAYGSVSRIVRTSIDRVREKGMKVGLLRPITLFPFPHAPLLELSRRIKEFFVVELNTGQMVEDVKLSVMGDARVDFFGNPPGSIPSPAQLEGLIEERYKRIGTA